MPAEPIIVKVKSWQYCMTNQLMKALQLMAEHNYISRQELERIFGSRFAVLRKLKALLKMKLIASFGTMLIPKVAYCLSLRGYHFLAKYGLLKVSRHFKPVEYKAITLAHTLACVQTQLAFEKHSYILDYKSAKVLNAGKARLPTLQPDAEFTFRENLMPDAKNFRGAVEVELSRKSPIRNQERIRKYDNRYELKIVVWVCGSNYIMRDLQSVIKSMSASPAGGRLQEPFKFRFVLYGDMLKNGLMDAIAVDWNNERQYIIFEILKPREAFIQASPIDEDDE